MALKIVYQYKSPHFSYSIREGFFKGQTLFFINVLAGYAEIHKHIAEKNNMFGCKTEMLAKKKIMKTLKDFCLGTGAEEAMKKLPIFQEEGYQEELF